VSREDRAKKTRQASKVDSECSEKNQAYEKRWKNANHRYSIMRRASVVLSRGTFAKARSASKFEVDEMSISRKGGFFGQRLAAEDMATYDIPVYQKPAELTEQLRCTLAAHFIFENVDELHLDDVVAAMSPVELRSVNEILFSKGEPSDALYLVETGGVITIGDERIEFGPGETLGDAALVSDKGHRKVSVVASKESTKLWRLDRQVFHLAIASLSESRARAAKAALSRVPLLGNNLSKAHLGALSRLVKLVRYQAMQKIITKGELGLDMFLIDSGRVVCRDLEGCAPDEELVLGPGDHFGERALLYDDTRAANVVALDDDTRCFLVSKKVFQSHLGQLSELLEISHIQRVLAAALHMRNQPDDLEDREFVFAALARAAISRKLENDYNFNDNTSDALYIIQSGIIASPGHIAGRGTVLAAPMTKTLLTNILASPLPIAESVQSDRVEILVITISDFLAALRSHHYLLDDEEIEQDTISIQTSASVNLEPSSPKSIVGKNEILNVTNCNDLEIFATLGAGSFGKVKLARHQDSGTVVALKMLTKAVIIATRQIGNVKSEKELLMKLRHPNIARCYGTFADEDYLYLMLELVLGGELYGRIKNDQVLDAYAVAFYTANIVLALEYIHSKRVLYRDLKPENALIDQYTGYLKLVDFGFAKLLAPDADSSYTICGTPEYMSPEILSGSGHGPPTDWWSLGCLLYEMCLGRTPFVKDSTQPTNQVLLYKAVASADLNFQDLERTFPKDNDQARCDFKDLATALLAKDWHERLGSAKAGATEIKRHPFLRDRLDWAKLTARDPKLAPWKPDVKNELDASNFTFVEDEEDEEDYDLDDIDVDKFSFDWW